jgi:hypothetical protein
MQTEFVIPEPVICKNIAEYPHINIDSLSQHALDSICSYYKKDTILIQYAMEHVNHDWYGMDGPEIEIRTLHVIIHDMFEFNKNTNLYAPVYRYDTFICEYIISCEIIPEYHIDVAARIYSNVVDSSLFA